MAGRAGIGLGDRPKRELTEKAGDAGPPALDAPLKDDRLEDGCFSFSIGVAGGGNMLEEDEGKEPEVEIAGREDKEPEEACTGVLVTLAVGVKGRFTESGVGSLNSLGSLLPSAPAGAENKTDSSNTLSTSLAVLSLLKKAGRLLSRSRPPSVWLVLLTTL